jgi:hypothetical protein
MEILENSCPMYKCQTLVLEQAIHDPRLPMSWSAGINRNSMKLLWLQK